MFGVAGANTLTWEKLQVIYRCREGLSWAPESFTEEHDTEFCFRKLTLRVLYRERSERERRPEAASHIRDLGQQRCMTGVPRGDQDLHLPSVPQSGQVSSSPHTRELSQCLGRVGWIVAGWKEGLL